MRRAFWLIALFAINTRLFSEAPFLQNMTKEEREKSGIEKLSEKEATYLQNWIQEHVQDLPFETQAERTQEIDTTLEQVEKVGKYLSLANGSKYKVSSKRARKKTVKWLPGDVISISYGKHYQWVNLKNKRAGEKVRAKFVDTKPITQEERNTTSSE